MAFERELGLLWEASQCKGVCRLYGGCKKDGELCMAMKLYQCSLDDKIKEAGGRGLQPAVAWRYSHLLCKALQGLQDKSILVLDIKPANVLLDEHDEPVFSDFGISALKRFDESHVMGGGRGTLVYMAPEACNPQQLGGLRTASDMWSLACVIVELLSGQRAWQDQQSGQALQAALLQGQPPYDLKRVLRHVLDPSDSKYVLLSKCFRFDPKQRPQPAQLAAETRRFK
jgi:serine/threonine protein kinase